MNIGWCLVLFKMMVVNEPAADINHLINQGQFEQAEAQIDHLRHQADLTAETQMNLHAWTGDIAFYRADYQSAHGHYATALTVAIDANLLSGQANQMKNIAIAHSEQGQYADALLWHEQAIEVINQLPPNDLVAQQIYLSELLSQGAIFGHVGAPELATETLAQAQQLAVQNGELAVVNNAYLRLAALHHNQDHDAMAMASLQLVNPALFKSGSSHAWYIGLKLMLLLNVRDWQAFDEQIQALASMEPIWPANFLQNMQVLQIERFLAAGELLEAGTLIEQLSESGSYSGSWLMPYLRGHWLESNHQLIEALEAYQTAIDLFLSQQETAVVSTTFNRIPKSLFSAALRSALHLSDGDHHQMFHWLQWLGQPKKWMTKKVNHTESSLTQGPMGKEEVMQDVVNAAFSSTLMNYDLSDLQGSLRDQEGVVVLQQIEQALWGFLITANDFRATLLTLDAASTQEQVPVLISQLKQQGAQWELAAMYLHQQLILPLDRLGLGELSHLHMIPDDHLRYVPVDFLLNQQGDMLIDRHQIMVNTLSGLGALVSDRQLKTSTQPTRMSFIGTNNNLPQMPSYWRTAYRSMNFNSRELTGIEEERAMLQQLSLPGLVYFGATATEAVARQLIAEETGILHISSHGFANPLAPAFSSLVLNPDANGDGLLQAREVSKLTSELSLLVLASCSSARGGLAGRYGNQMGMAEAFLHSGVRTVIGTLWDVKDQPTATFMQWFYESLSAVHVPAIALHETKLKARNAGWSAEDWSAFVLLGDNTTVLNMQAVEAQDHDSHLWWLLSVLIGLVLLKRVQKHK